MNQFDKKSLPYRALKKHQRLFQKVSRKLISHSFYSKTFGQTLSPHEVLEKTLGFSEELTDYYTLYQLFLFHFQEKRVDEFFELIQENLKDVNHYFKTVFRTFLRQNHISKMHQKHIIQMKNWRGPKETCLHHSEHTKRENLSGSLQMLITTVDIDPEQLLS